ncbi:hypothetical protein M3P21_08690 [Ruegeria sp. 2012CJ41-6]|uniref:Uncharacterized protein n=1 Tax=Ruegeria spongiae TaxID=2942209 RepID=A0ABT0Q1D8_9RHOB|nr:hypothetical protein [Ruegeria spongiae]MCL6283612.1 hypothetical protein [Ruegeria spongiae]
MQKDHWFTEKLVMIASNVSNEFPNASMEKVRAMVDVFAEEASLTLRQKAALLKRAGLRGDFRRCATSPCDEGYDVSQPNRSA